MNRKYDTAWAQNIIAGVCNGVYLNIENPEKKIKEQYYKATAALQKARHEFDQLNDLLEQEQE